MHPFDGDFTLYLDTKTTQWQVITLLSCHHSSRGLAVWYSRSSRQTASNCLSVCLSVLAADNQERIARSLLPSDRSAVPSGDGPSTATSPLPHSHVIQGPKLVPRRRISTYTSTNSALKWSEKLRGLCGRELPSSNAGPEIGYIGRCFLLFQSLYTNGCLMPRSNRKRPLARPFQLFSSLSSWLWMLYRRDYLQCR